MTPGIAEKTLLVSSVVVGLTPLIPIPLLDDAVKGYVERRMVRAIGEAHGVELSKEDVSQLVDEVDSNLLRSIAIGVVTFPAKLIFRKLFVVLEVKRASDEASRAYHRGYLLDRALSSRLLAPRGAYSSSALRKALDSATANSDISPLGGAIRVVFQRSTDVMEIAGKGLIERLRKGQGSVSQETVERAVDGTAGEGPVATLAARLQKALSELPAGHFRELEERFESALGAKLARELE